MPECKKKKEKNNSIVVMSVLYTKGEKNVNRKCDFCKRKNKRFDEDRVSRKPIKLKRVL